MWRRNVFAALIFAALCINAHAAKLVWDANTEPHLRGYKIHYGSASGQYTETVDVGNVTEWPIPDEWPRDRSYYFAATAYAECARCPGGELECPPETWEFFYCESGYSNEAVYYAEATPPLPATDVRVVWRDLGVPTVATIIVKSDGSGDYTSLAAAITAASAGDTIEIQGTWASADTTNHSISKNLTIRATGSAKHPGYVGSSPTHWRLKPTTSGSHALTISADVTLEGLDLCNASTGASDEVIRINADDSDLVLNNCLIWLDSKNDQQDLIYFNGASADGATVTLNNCIGWNAYRSVVGVYLSNGVTININSSSFWNIGGQDVTSSDPGNYRVGLVGITNVSGAAATVNVFNTLCHLAYTSNEYGEVFPEVNNANSPVITVDRCIFNCTADNTDTKTDCIENGVWTDDDSKSSDGNWVIFQDLTSAPYDFRLATNTYNEAQDAHADSSGANLSMPAADIIGTSRPQNTNYDIGAFEIAAAAAKAIPPSILSRQRNAFHHMMIR